MNKTNRIIEYFRARLNDKPAHHIDLDSTMLLSGHQSEWFYRLMTEATRHRDFHFRMCYQDRTAHPEKGHPVTTLSDSEVEYHQNMAKTYEKILLDLMKSRMEPRRSALK